MVRTRAQARRERDAKVASDRAARPGKGDLGKVYTHIKTLKRMSVPQEYGNAFSMLLPAAYCLHFCSENGVWALDTVERAGQALVTAGACLHCPFSFAYHYWCAVNPRGERTDNHLRRLDQAFIYVAGAVNSYALSRDWTFTLVNAAYGAACIFRLWTPGCTHVERKVTILFGSFLYTTALLWRGEFLQFWLVYGAFIAAVLCFLFGGWGHALFHCALAPYLALVLRSVQA